MRFFWLRLFSSGSRDEVSTTIRKRHTLLAFVSKSRGQPKSGARHRQPQHNCSYTGFGRRPLRYLTPAPLCRLRDLALKDPISTMVSANCREGGGKASLLVLWLLVHVQNFVLLFFLKRTWEQESSGNSQRAGCEEVVRLVLKVMHKVRTLGLVTSLEGVKYKYHALPA